MPKKSKSSAHKSTPKSRVRAVHAAVATAAATTTGGRAHTIIYVHGIANKPPGDVLKCQWDHALFGFDLGDKSRLSYWVDRVRYPQASPGSCHNADSTQLPSPDGSVGVRSVGAKSDSPESLVPPEATGTERKALERLARETVAAGDVAPGPLRTREFGARVLPLPGFLRDFITRQITKQFLKDVSDFLFDKARRDFMLRTVTDRLESGGGPFVVIGHSQGSMIAYEALRTLAASKKIEVELFVTIGSPLGLTEVKDQLKKFAGGNALAVPTCVKRWVNVADPIDPVCADKTLRDEYRATNGGRWRISSVGIRTARKIPTPAPAICGWTRSGSRCAPRWSAIFSSGSPRSRSPAMW